MNRLQKHLSNMTRDAAVKWYLAINPKSKVRRKSTIYREILKNCGAEHHGKWVN